MCTAAATQGVLDAKRNLRLGLPVQRLSDSDIADFGRVTGRPIAAPVIAAPAIRANAAPAKAQRGKRKNPRSAGRNRVSLLGSSDGTRENKSLLGS